MNWFDAWLMISSCLADRLLFSVAQVKQLQLPVMVEPMLFFLKCHEVKLGIKVESWNKRWPCWTLKLADRPFCLLLSVVEVTLVLESPQEAFGLKHALKRSTSIIQPKCSTGTSSIIQPRIDWDPTWSNKRTAVQGISRTLATASAGLQRHAPQQHQKISNKTLKGFVSYTNWKKHSAESPTQI